MKRSSKFKCWGICSIVTGIVLIVLGIAMPFIIKSLTEAGVKDGAGLKESTKDNWTAIPGKNDVKLLRHFYLYDCINYEDVSYHHSHFYFYLP